MQQYKSLLKVVKSCETLSQLDHVEPWFKSVYKKWYNECKYLCLHMSLKESVRCAKMFDEVTDFMFDELGDIIKNKKVIKVRGFC